MNAKEYQHNNLSVFVKELDNLELQYGFSQQAGATADTIVKTTAYLKKFFDKRLISFHTVIEFPPRSPCLTIIDYSVFPYLKNKIFRVSVANL